VGLELPDTSKSVTEWVIVYQAVRLWGNNIPSGILKRLLPAETVWLSTRHIRSIFIAVSEYL
jgi:hypothetical protein